MGILRLLLALAVLAAHGASIGKLHLVGGQVAVQSFYIISGFYMSLIINEKYVGQNNSYKLFITNRFLRLYPIYWAVLLGTLFTSIAIVILTKGHVLLTFESYLSVKTNIFSFFYLVLTNIIIFGQDIVMFLGINPENGNLFFTQDFRNANPPLYSFLFITQAWTLGLELTFYLIAPFILRKGFKVVIPLILMSLLLRLFLYNQLHLKNDPWTYRFFPTEIMFFLFGYLGYRGYLRIKSISLNKYINIFTFAFIIAFTTSFSYLPASKADYLPFSYRELGYFLSITLSIPLLFNFLKKNKLDNQIGELSYPVYISHILVFLFCGGLPFTLLKIGWVKVLLTIIFAYLLNKVVAMPLEKYRQSRLN
ncbi:Peptidoglycan/LPS O-acetylase OafA/YrhL, contains acyltransferase and SGNH-hydrolase domains [Chitinophaga sp. CF118]|uniref:acyltransferase family protein n=1 Tax=Chitinophaga sp. CF118 TaxID=1884367 RepID=UPI0008E65F0E|nr:acyltransferase [Chitinophaga sp. CF118]SFE26958.1 Peptidoglycan/LPS O-acetylase OafA/YrhL, contains acyltransferase and SGNH-hydrolase domains [Chitinophaga sp. CF118]